MLFPFTSRAYGVVTLLYVLTNGCCTAVSLPALFVGLDPHVTAADLSLAVVCTALYLGGAVPAALGLVASPSTRLVLVSWATMVLIADCAATVVFIPNHGDQLAPAFVNEVCACAWPAFCVLTLPFLGSPPEEPGE